MENAPTEVDDEAVVVESAPDAQVEEAELLKESGELDDYDQQRLESFFTNLNSEALKGYGDGSDEAYEAICRTLRGEGNPLTKEEFSRLKNFLMKRQYVDGANIGLAKDSDGSDSLGAMLAGYGNEPEPAQDVAEAASEITNEVEEGLPDYDDLPDIADPKPEEMDEVVGPAESVDTKAVADTDNAERIERRSESIAEIFRNGKRGRKLISLTSLLGGSSLLSSSGKDSRIIERADGDSGDTAAETALSSLTSVLNEVKEREAEAAEAQMVEDMGGASTPEELTDAGPLAEEQEKPKGEAVEVVEQPNSPEEAPPASPPPKLEDLGEIDEKSRSVLFDLAERWGIDMSDASTESELEAA